MHSTLILKLFIDSKYFIWIFIPQYAVNELKIKRHCFNYFITGDISKGQHKVITLFCCKMSLVQF